MTNDADNDPVPPEDTATGAGAEEHEVLTGDGPAWPPPPAVEDLPAPPNWRDGRAIAGVWRETLAFSAGAVFAGSEPEFAHMRLGAPWAFAPAAGSDADIDQAIAAKIHIGIRALSSLAAAQLLVCEPEDVEAVPPWASVAEAAAYAADLQLPATPIFLDFEGADGRPVIWEDDKWPLPFTLRGALCWTRDGLLSIVPYGSVSGMHPWGGNDYQAWARWVFNQRDGASLPDPGPGDFVVDRDDGLLPWVAMDQPSICAHQGAVAGNLVNQALRTLWMLEALGARLGPPDLPRPERRRAARAGQTIGWVATGLPRPTPHARGHDHEAADNGFTEACPVATAHTRINQAHRLWHEALAAYDEPEAFTTKLNALLQALRHFQYGIEHDLKSHPAAATAWWTGRMGALVKDARIKWLVDARNAVVHETDLATHSRAHARIVGTGLKGPEYELDVEPSIRASDVARQLRLPALSDAVRESATLVVERRWSVNGLPGDEILDVLADTHGLLVSVLAEAHQQLAASIDTCEKTGEDPCDEPTALPHPSGRPPCMWAGREARTSRRNLVSRAPTRVVADYHPRPVLDPDEMRERYAFDGIEALSPDMDLAERGRILHQYARRIFESDGFHIMLAWLFRDRRPVSRVVLEPERPAAKYLMIERLGGEATRLGADEVILTTEAWTASFDPDDPATHVRAELREDRSEVLLTHALSRGGQINTWTSPVVRNRDQVKLGEVTHDVDAEYGIFDPLVEAWATWPT